MASKYKALRDVMGSSECWNDKGSKGRILKWYGNTCGATLTERKVQAAEVLAKLHAAGLTYVQKVTVRNCKTSRMYYAGVGKGDGGGSYIVSTSADTDKIAVYIDEI